MGNLIEKIKAHPQIFHSSRSKMVVVWETEDRLKLTFPEEYESYLCHFGAIGFGPVEWTGLNIDPELNVLRTTREARERFADFPDDCFVLRVQDAKGDLIICDEGEHIYACRPRKKAEGETAGDETAESSRPELCRALICDSLSEYFDQCLEEVKSGQ